MNLQDIFDARYDLENDAVVSPDYDEQGYPTGFKYGVYSCRNGWSFREENKGLATPEIIQALGKQGYVTVNKRSAGQPFDVCWDYRQENPDWPTFRDWIYIYYAELEAATNHSAAAIYLDICMKMYDNKPELEEAIAWTHTQNGIIYKDLEAILRDYQEKGKQS